MKIAVMQPTYLPCFAEHGQRDGFADVTIEPGDEGALAVAVHGARRERHDRSRGKVPVAAQFGEDAETIETGHMKIQNDEVGLKLPGGLQSFDAVVRFGDRITRTLEHGADQFAAGCLIVRYQHFFH